MFIDLVALLGVLTLALLSPGPDFLLVVTNSVGGSRARALATAVGIAAGLAVQATVVSLGYAALPAGFLRVVQAGGALFLAWLGSRALLAQATAPAAEGLPVPAGRDSARSGFVDGLLCNITNPKVFLFFVGLFAQIIHADSSLTWRIVVPATVVVHGLVLWSLIVLVLQSPPVERRLRRAQRWLPRVFGIALLVLALWLGWQAWRG